MNIYHYHYYYHTIILNITIANNIILSVNSNINIHIHISTRDKYISIIFFLLSSTSHSPPRPFLRNHRPPLTHYIVCRNTILLPTLTQTTMFILLHHDELYIHKPNTYPYIYFNILQPLTPV